MSDSSKLPAAHTTHLHVSPSELRTQFADHLRNVTPDASVTLFVNQNDASGTHSTSVSKANVFQTAPHSLEWESQMYQANAGRASGAGPSRLESTVHPAVATLSLVNEPRGTSIMRDHPFLQAPPIAVGKSSVFTGKASLTSGGVQWKEDEFQSVDADTAVVSNNGENWLGRIALDVTGDYTRRDGRVVHGTFDELIPVLLNVQPALA